MKAALRGHDYATQVQMLAPEGHASAETHTARVHAAAAEGVRSGDGPLPYGDRIQRSFGGYDISNVIAHTGAAAEQAAGAMGANAYATGNDVVLGRGGTDLHTVAHEAAHVVQQRAGVSLSSGIGHAGDPYERHADAVADLVVQGKSAEGLLGEMAGKPSVGSPEQGAVQRKEDDNGAEPRTPNGGEDTVDAELATFLKEGVFGPYDLTAPTNIGGFSAQYDVASGTLTIRVRGSIEFIDGLRDAGYGIIFANHPSLWDAANACQSLMAHYCSDRAGPQPEPDRSLLDAFLADFQWLDTDTAAWLAKMKANVEDAWSGKFSFFMDRPGWEAISAAVRVETDIRADQRRADDHIAIRVYKVPDSGRYGLGAYVQPSGVPQGNEMVLSSRANRTPEDRIRAGDDGLLERTVGPFFEGSGDQGESIIEDTWRFNNDFRVAEIDRASPIHVTGRASRDEKQAPDHPLAEERAETIVGVLKDGELEVAEITTDVEEGSGPDMKWRCVDIRVGDGRPQATASHEFGHALGLGDCYDNSAERGGTLTGSGQEVGTVSEHDALARDIGVTGGALHENNDRLMSVGNNVSHADYATIGWALKTITRRPEWRVKA